jgi:hypothetical protein
MSNLDLLKSIRNLFGLRGVGNTSLMRMGTENYDRKFFVISHSREYSEELIRGSMYGIAKTVKDIISLYNYDSPVVIDHHVLASLISDTVKEIEDSNVRIYRMKNAINRLMPLIEYYQDRSIIIENLYLELAICRWWQFSKKKRLRSELLNKMGGFSRSAHIEKLFLDIEELLSHK